MRTGRENQLKAERIAIESAELGLDTQRFSAAAEMIETAGNPAAGAKYFEEMGYTPVKAAKLAQDIYDRQVKRGDMKAAADTAYAAGDFATYGRIMNGMYGDIAGIDFTTMVNEGNRAKFQEGMGLVAQAVTMFGFDEADKAAAWLEQAGAGGLFAKTKQATGYQDVYKDLVKAGTIKQGDGAYTIKNKVQAEIAKRNAANSTGGSINTTELFKAMKLQADPAYQFANSLSDETIEGMIDPDSKGTITVEQMRQRIGNLSLTGGMTAEVDKETGKVKWVLDPSAANLFQILNGGDAVTVNVGGEGDPVPGTKPVPTITGTLEKLNEINAFNSKVGGDAPEVINSFNQSPEYKALTDKASEGEYLQAYNAYWEREGKVLVAKFEPYEVSGAGANKVASDYGKYTPEQISILAQKPEFKADSNFTAIIEKGTGTVVKKGFPNFETIRNPDGITKGDFSKWNSNLGKLVTINGKNYAVSRIKEDSNGETGTPYVYDLSAKPPAEIKLSSLISTAKEEDEARIEEIKTIDPKDNPLSGAGNLNIGGGGSRIV
jgi:hypothetical protein